MDATTGGFLGRFAPISGFMGSDQIGFLGVPFDGTSTIYWPTAFSHWASLLLPVPSYRYQCQEAATPLVDDVRGATMAESGAVSYRQAASEAKYARRGVATADGTASRGFTAIAGTHWDVGWQSIVAYLEFEATTFPGGNRALLAFTGASSFWLGMVPAIAGQAQLSCRSGATANGAVNYNDGKKHPVMVEIIPNNTVLDHTGAGLFRFSTDKEQITGTWSLASDGTKGLETGGSASLTAAPAKIFDLTVWTGTDAETINTLTPKVALQRLGWTVTGY